ncbi:hypothetical protein [Pseudonocardia sp. H11422]|uniref:hypothetical protein n=1 Tax=Pseudonocardia sp. H11422 TaxID=2835866 RepID=UPI001BDBCE98|nr:hypothetical protein [Pseudonocardia sp. H11422]
MSKWDDTGELHVERAHLAGLYAFLDRERAAAAAEHAAVLRDSSGTGHPERRQREVAVQTLAARLRRSRAAENGLCFENPRTADDHLVHIGRAGLLDPADDHRPLLTDWRAPAARPFYTATAANPEGVRRRRHFRTRGRALLDFHDDRLQNGPDNEKVRALAAAVADRQSAPGADEPIPIEADDYAEGVLQVLDVDGMDDDGET